MTSAAFLPQDMLDAMQNNDLAMFDNLCNLHPKSLSGPQTFAEDMSPGRKSMTRVAITNTSKRTLALKIQKISLLFLAWEFYLADQAYVALFDNLILRGCDSCAVPKKKLEQRKMIIAHELHTCRQTVLIPPLWDIEKNANVEQFRFFFNQEKKNVFFNTTQQHFSNVHRRICIGNNIGFVKFLLANLHLPKRRTIFFLNTPKKICNPPDTVRKKKTKKKPPNKKAMFKSANFSCKLETRQCEAETKKGEQCKRRTRKQLPYCYEHTRLLLHVEIRPSTIEGAGLGLFALEDFERGSKIVPYVGEIITEAEFDRRYGEHNATYALQIKKDVVIDSACSRGIGAFINMGVTKKDNNAVFRLSGNKKRFEVFVHAKKKIHAGQEIFVDYGSDYLFS